MPISPGGPQCITRRTFEISNPIPNVIVPIITRKQLAGFSNYFRTASLISGWVQAVNMSINLKSAKPIGSKIPFIDMITGFFIPSD